MLRAFQVLFAASSGWLNVAGAECEIELQQSGFLQVSSVLNVTEDVKPRDLASAKGLPQTASQTAYRFSELYAAQLLALCKTYKSAILGVRSSTEVTEVPLRHEIPDWLGNCGTSALVLGYILLLLEGSRLLIWQTSSLSSWFQANDEAASGTSDTSDTSTKRLYPILLLSFSAFAMMCETSYLLNLPEMAADLGCSDNLVAITVAANWIMKGLTASLLGPLSDKVGRKPIMVGCTILLIITPFACAAAQNVWYFLAARLLQGVGEGADAVVNALVRDVYSDLGERLQIMGKIQATLFISPLIAPLLGALGAVIGWRTVFYIFVVWGIINLQLACYVIVHTHRVETSLSEHLNEARKMLSNKPLLGLLSVLVVTWSLKQGSITALPFILEETFGLNEIRSAVFLIALPFLTATGIILATQLSRFYAPVEVIAFTTRLAFLLAILFLVFALFLANSVWGLMVPLYLSASINMASNVIATTLFMEPTKEHAGAAGGVLSSVREISGGVFSLFVGQLAIATNSRGLLCFNGSCMAAMVCFFWFAFGSDPPKWALTDGK